MTRPTYSGLAAGGQSAGYRIAAWITLLDVLVAACFSLVCLAKVDVAPTDGTSLNRATFMFAMQAAGSSLALATVCVLVIRAGSKGALIALGAVAALMRGFDAAAGAVEGDEVMAITSGILAMAQGCALVLLDDPATSGRWGQAMTGQPSPRSWSGPTATATTREGAG